MIVYKTTNLINGKIYIGQTKKDLNKVKYFGSGILISKAIRKYGKENFSVEVLCESDWQDEIDIFEDFWIRSFNSKDINIGYNVCDGGLGSTYGPLSKEQKEKISKTMLDRGTCSGKNNPFYGRKHSNETKEKIRQAKLGKKLTDEHKMKISLGETGQVRSHRGRPLSDEHKEKLVRGWENRAVLGKKKSPQFFSEDHRKNLSIAVKKSWEKRKQQKEVR